MSKKSFISDIFDKIFPKIKREVVFVKKVGKYVVFETKG